MKNKLKIADYVNRCSKCFITSLGENSYPEVLNVQRFKMEKDKLTIGVKEKDIDKFNVFMKQKIAVTMWDKIKGYSW